MSPRDKTRAHMQKLLAVAALAAGCSKRHEPGYGVVDPMPPPAQCPGTFGQVTARATFLGTDVLLEVDFSKSASSKPRVGQAAQSWDGKVVAEEVVGDLLRVRVRPAAGATNVNLTMPVQCASAGQLGARLSWATPPSGPQAADDGGIPPLANGPPQASTMDAGKSRITVDLHDQ